MADNQNDRLKIAKAHSEKYDIVAGIGDRWEDNELHLAVGCMSTILEEYSGNWDIVKMHLLN